MRSNTTITLLSCFLFLAVSWQCRATFSIVAVDPDTGEVGSAGASCLDDNDIAGGVLIISRIHPGKGAINTQSYWHQENQNNASLGMTSFGLSPQEIIDLLQDDDAQFDPQIRQYGIVDFDDDGNPRSAGFTGTDCFDWKGHQEGPTYSIQGNILLNEEVLTGMVAAFEASEGEPLAIRLMAAMQAANLAGADSRCLEEGVSSQSAFVRVAKPDDAEDDLWLDIQITSTAFGVEPLDVLQDEFDIWLAEENAGDCQELPPPASLEPTMLATPMGQEYGQAYKDLFGNYSIPSSLGSVQVLTNENISNDFINHAGNVITHFLHDVPFATHGEKEDLRVQLNNAWAALAIFENEAQLESPEAEALWECDPKIQDLWLTEMVKPGSPEWLDASQRDASFEEILHFIHDYGIAPSNSVFQAAIQAASDEAVANGTYQPLSDLAPEDYDNEYLAIGMECYYGFWQHDPQGDGFAGDQEYPYISRAAIEANDPALFAILNDFFPPLILTPLSIDEDFRGTFYMDDIENVSADYKYKAQYYTRARFLGTNDNSFWGNKHGTRLQGNSGNNSFHPFGGFDVIDGDEGEDTLVLQGNCGEYNILTTESGFIYVDLIENRDDTNEMLNIEWIRHADCVTAAGTMTGIEEFTADISIFPNPARNGERIYFETDESIKEIRLIALDGKSVLEKKILNSANQLELPNIQAGIYFLEFKNKVGARSVQKIIIE